MHLAWLLLLAVLVGCDSAAPAAPSTTVSTSTPSLMEGARGTHGEGLLTYTSKPWGFDTNSYFLVGPDGLVMIDTQFLPSAAADAVTWAEASTGKRVELAIVLHANPDKFNGTRTLQDRGVRVVTSRAIADLIGAVHEKRSGWFGKRYAPDYPGETPAPEVVQAGTLEAAGLTLEIVALGPGCSEAHIAVVHRGQLFVGDLVASGTHAWLELGHVDAWQARLDELAARAPQKVHPGRGPSGGPELIAAQRRYLDRVGELTRAHIARATDREAPSDDELAALRDAVTAAYPDLGYSVFLKLGLPAVWRHLAAQPRGT